MAKNQPITMSGQVYCDWNAFTFVSPIPDRLKTGDLVIWSWSGDSKKPSSKSKSGLFRVSVFDGKRRRALKVKHSRVHRLLAFSDDTQREQRLSALVRELRALKGRSAIHAARGYEIAPSDNAPEVDEPSPTKSSAAPQSSAAESRVAKPVQGSLF